MTTPKVYATRGCDYSVHADHVLMKTNSGSTQVPISSIVKVVREVDSIVLRLTEGSAYIALRGEERDSFLAELDAVRGVPSAKG